MDGSPTGKPQLPALRPRPPRPPFRTKDAHIAAQRDDEVDFAVRIRAIYMGANGCFRMSLRNRAMASLGATPPGSELAQSTPPLTSHPDATARSRRRSGVGGRGYGRPLAPSAPAPPRSKKASFATPAGLRRSSGRPAASRVPFLSCRHGPDFHDLDRRLRDLKMRVTFEDFCGGFVRLGFDERIQHDVVLGVRDTAR